MNKLQHLQYLNLNRPSRYADNITAIQVKPSLDLNFARNKSLIDNVTGNNLVTFTRASSGTYMGSDGVLKRATTNLLLRSEEFDNAIWTKANITATSNQTTAPDGSANADLIAGNAGTALKYIYQSYSAATSGAFTFSVFAKAGTESFIVVRVTDQGGVNEVRQQFNLSSGAVSGSVVVNGTATTASSSINPVGNGWYQCVVTATFAAFTQLQGNVWLNSYAAVSLTTNFYLWGAQLEQSSTVGEYIPTTSTINSAPRFNHNPTTGESLGLLVEESRTNSIRNNTMVGAVAGTPGTPPTNWANVIVTGLTASVASVGTQNGISYIDVRVNGTPSTSSFYNLVPDTLIAGVSGQTWTGSFWGALVGGSLANTNAQIELRESDASQAFLANTTNSITLSGSLNRFSLTRTLNNVSTAFVSVRFIFQVTSGLPVDFTFRIGLPQLEEGAFATSVIPTTTAAATRSADVASITGTNFSSWYRQDEGTVYFSAKTNFAVPSGPFPRAVQIQGATGSDRIEQSFFNGGQVCYLRNSAAIQAEWYPNYFIQNGVTSSFALATNNIAGSSNGVITGTDSVAVLPTVDRMIIGAETSFGNFLNGTISRITYFRQRLSNAKLQKITQ